MEDESLKERAQLLQVPNLMLIKEVGFGGMSTVWKAWDTFKQRNVAVKVLNRDLSGSEEDIRAFREEAMRLKSIRHPGIVEAYDFNCSNGNWFYVMEFVDGYTFADLLKRKQHVRESDCLLICESVAAALDYAWNDHGLVHCDIKPENIMINTDGVIKLTDLGISHQFEFAKGAIETPDHVLGTPAYISPEQVYGDVELDCRADIYSLAATLYHLSTGRMLFPGMNNESTMRAHCNETLQAPDPRHYRSELSIGFAQLLEAMLVKNREFRIASWGDVFAMCQSAENGAAFDPRANSSPSSIKLA